MLKECTQQYMLYHIIGTAEFSSTKLREQLLAKIRVGLRYGFACMPSNAKNTSTLLEDYHDEQYRSDQPVLLVVPFELGLCFVYGAADSLLNMVLHDVPTGKLQVVDILNRRRNADNCVRYLRYYLAYLIRFARKTFLYLHRHSKNSCVPSRYFWTTE